MKIYPLKRKKEFAATLGQGKKFVKKFFILLYNNKENQSDIKLGIIASKKVLRLATQRNKAKRRLKAAFNKAFKQSNVVICGNFVMIARNKILTESFQNIVSSLQDLVKEI